MRLPLSLIDWKHHVDFKKLSKNVEPLVIQSVNMLRNNEFQEFFALPHGFPWIFHYHIMLHSTCNPRKTLVVSRRQWPSEAGNDEGSLSQHPLSEGSTRIHVIPKLLGGVSPSNWIIIPRVLLVNIKKMSRNPPKLNISTHPVIFEWYSSCLAHRLKPQAGRTARWWVDFEAKRYRIEPACFECLFNTKTLVWNVHLF